ncbi:MAG: NAD-dependent epimerase/dehydratase family protein [Aureispira sp.]|nr:NAD-dependent epimerase/dehydratase family protein [Aureispira sp.]
MKKILVTGAAGFIGSHLVDTLLAEGFEVVGLDNLRNGHLGNLEEALPHEHFNFVKGDIVDPFMCLRICKDIDVVYHLACMGVRHSLHSPFENHKVNAEGTLNMLEGAKYNGVKHFFYISTSEVYGKVEEFPISETALPIPITVYGASKLAGEHYTHAYNECFGLSTTVLRIFNNYGPRAHYEGDSGELIPRTIINFFNGKAATQFGDGSVTRDFYYVKDTARILMNMMDRPQLAGGPFNLGTSEEIKICDVIAMLAELMPEYNPTIDVLPERLADVPRLWVNNSKLSALMDISSEISFKEGLVRTIAFYKKQWDSGLIKQEVPVQNWT